jgi:hypothetical protein
LYYIYTDLKAQIDDGEIAVFEIQFFGAAGMEEVKPKLDLLNMQSGER